MNAKVPKEIALSTLQNLPSSASWPKILGELLNAWASTAPAAVLARAIEVFEDEKKAIGWLTSPSRALGNRIPLVLVESEKGQQDILDELYRIEHGVYS